LHLRRSDRRALRDPGGIGHREFHLPAQREGKITGQPAGERIGRQQYDRAVIGPPWHNPVPLRQISGQRGGDRLGNRGRQLLDPAQAELRRHRSKQFDPANQSALNRGVRERFIRGAAFVAQARERRR
jgi:hypothetical protein